MNTRVPFFPALVACLLVAFVALTAYTLIVSRNEAQSLRQQNAELRDQVATFKRAEIRAQLEAEGVAYKYEGLQASNFAPIGSPAASPQGPAPSEFVICRIRNAESIALGWKAKGTKWVPYVSDMARIVLNNHDFTCDAPEGY